MTKLAAYDRNMASTQVLRRGFSPKGSSDIFQRQARAICGNMPKGSDSSIHDQCISLVTH